MPQPPLPTPRKTPTPASPPPPKTPHTPHKPQPPQPPGPSNPPAPANAIPRLHPHPPGPYRRLFAVPGARAFTVGNLLARLPMGMFSVSAVVMIAGVRGSYGLAGAVTATGLAATAAVAPWTARLVDRYGQARIAVPATAFAALGSLALLLCVRFDAPAWTLFAAYAATATTPNTGGMSRARWAHLLKGDESALHTANSFEQAADELCFMLGPVLAAFLCGTFFPEAGTLVGAVLLLSGMLLFAAQRSTEPPVRRHARAKSPLRTAGMPQLLTICLVMGAVFGSMEVVTIAFADAQGHRSAAGVVLALQAAGSCAAGLLYGALRPTGPASARLPWCLAAMAALLPLPLLAAALTGSLPLLAGALLIAGMATAPTMVTTMTLVQQRTPEGRLNEGMTLAVTGLLGGIACGSATGGSLVDHLSPTAGFGVPATAAAMALTISLIHRIPTDPHSNSRPMH
ncbi:MFS transporter [Streptomyces sp. NBC_00005]|uniref:MFS transporter n=1 Tax=Streptomyces sp. NBC_00005 TaxID=2903609 RepID=UPI00324E0626